MQEPSEYDLGDVLMQCVKCQCHLLVLWVTWKVRLVQNFHLTLISSPVRIAQDRRGASYMVASAS